MARARQLKPDFFKDEDLAACSHAARLLFQGLWTMADRRGRLEDRPLKIKAEVFPYEDTAVEPLLCELARPKAYGRGSLVQRYEVDGRNYLQITGFEKHQKCHPREPDSTFPGPAVASRGEAMPRRGQAMSGQPESVPSESESESESDADPSGPSARRPAADGPSATDGAAAEASLAPINTANRIGPERGVLEAEALTLVREISARDGRDPEDVMAEACTHKGRRGSMNPASMTEARLLNTVMDLRKMWDRERPLSPLTEHNLKALGMTRGPK